MFRSSLRVALIYTIAFALAVVALGAVTFFATRQALTKQFDARILAEVSALAQEQRTEGVEEMLQAVRQRDETPGGLDYGLQGPGSTPLAGRLASARTAPGWSTLNVEIASKDTDAVRIFTEVLPGGYRLLVGDEEERIEALDGIVLRGFSWAFFGVLLIGVAGGYGMSRDINRRMAAFSATAEAIIEGDMTRRAPVSRSGDDLDRLALTINRMLDRIAGLMENLRQVSNDVAHDLRTPLTRLRNRLEAELARQGGQGAAIEAALDELDGILDTFSALLRISQIETGARRAAFRALDLSAVAVNVVEAFAPSAEESRRDLRLGRVEPAAIDGDWELLNQMAVNLVENALRYTEPGAHVLVEVTLRGDQAVLSVSDDGPGVPESARERLFDRFFRLESSRSTPGSGLGLALVAAVAKLHDGEALLLDAGPGLRVEVALPLRR